MNKVTILTCLLAAFSAAGDTLLSGDSIEALSFDFTPDALRVVPDKADIYAFACNSDPGWAAGGDETVESHVRVYRASAQDAADLASWQLGDSVDLSAVYGEGIVFWSPTAQSLYKAELLVGGVVVDEAFFDLQDTGGFDSRTSIGSAEVTLAATVYEFAGRPVQAAVVKVELDGQVLEAGTDYTVQYEDNVDVGEAAAIIFGIGRCRDQVRAVFQIVPVAESRLGGDDEACRIDGTTNEVLVVRCRQELQPFVWNTSEAFTEGGCEWIIGGLPEEEEALATVTMVPMETLESEPDETKATVLVARSGEGVATFRGAPGIYEARLTVSVGGVLQAGQLRRVIHILEGKGFILFVQ